jgi:hypothetical protein
MNWKQCRRECSRPNSRSYPRTCPEVPRNTRRTWIKVAVIPAKIRTAHLPHASQARNLSIRANFPGVSLLSVYSTFRTWEPPRSSHPKNINPSYWLAAKSVVCWKTTEFVQTISFNSPTLYWSITLPYNQGVYTWLKFPETWNLQYYTCNLFSHSETCDLPAVFRNRRCVNWKRYCKVLCVYVADWNSPKHHMHVIRALYVVVWTLVCVCVCVRSICWRASRCIYVFFLHLNFVWH